MSPLIFSHEELVREAQFNAEDLTEIAKRRRDNNRLGFAYQLAFVRLTQRFPEQQPLEIVDELLTYVSLQIGIPSEAIEDYQVRQPTLTEHRSAILNYLGLRRFNEAEIELLEEFLFEEACRLEQTGPLLIQAKQFLKEAGILFPADDTLRRLIVIQKQNARNHINVQMADSLSATVKERLDELLITGDTRLTAFQSLKQPPGKAAPPAMLRLAAKLELIQETGVLDMDISWLNNNYQRSLTRYARRCSADRMRQLTEERRYTVLVCFLWQVYRDSLDQMVEMHHKLMTRIYNHAQEDVDEQTRKHRRMIRSSLTTLHTLGQTILNEDIADTSLRQALFSQVDREKLILQMADVETWLTGKYSHVFKLVVGRFSYIRQFAPTLLSQLDFRLEEGTHSTLVEATTLLRQMNEENKRKLPDDAPLEFIPRNLRPLVEKDGEVSQQGRLGMRLTHSYS